METIFAIFGAACLVWIITRWLKLVWFRTKTLRVIKVDLAYDAAVPGMQTTTFNAVTRSARSAGGNEYDAAIAFMLVQLGVLSEPMTEKSRIFIEEKLGLICAIEHLSKSGSPPIDEWVRSKQWR
jgi:hypothetical protein